MSSRTRSCRDWLTSQRCRMCRMAAPQKRALMCFLFSSVNTSDCSRTSAHPLHCGCYNTRPLQGFLQEVSNLQLESHRPTSESATVTPMGSQEAILHKQHWGGRRRAGARKGWQSDTSETSLSLGHRTVTANATTQEGASLSTRQYYPEYYHYNTPVRLHRAKIPMAASTYQLIQGHEKTHSLPVLLNYAMTYYYFQVETRPVTSLCSALA